MSSRLPIEVDRIPRSLVRALLVGACSAGIAGVVVLDAFAWLAPRTSIGELAGDLRFLLGTATLLAALPLLLLHRWSIALVGIVLAGLHMSSELSLCLGTPAEPGTGTELRVLGANLLYGTADPELLLAAIVDARADLVALSEVSEPNASGTRWSEVFENWRERFPHQVHIEGKPFSLELLSRYPLEGVEGHQLDEPLRVPGTGWTSRRMLVEADVQVGASRVKVFAAHFPIPFGSWSLAARRQLLDRIVRERNDGPTIVLGDLNATSTSPLFADLLERANLRDSRRGFGPCFSWRPRFSPVHVLAIDHVLVSADITVLDRALGPEIDSDHLPVRAVLRLPLTEPMIAGPR